MLLLYLSSLQRFTTDAMASIVWLCEQMLQGEVDEETAKTQHYSC